MYLSVEGHLYCFSFLAIVNKTTVNTTEEVASLSTLSPLAHAEEGNNWITW